MGGFRDLIAWQLAQALTVDIYRATDGFPPSERFGLTSQIRRAAVSVASNLAEGAGRNTPGELRRYASIARGSVHELTCQTMLARDLGFLSNETTEQLLAKEGRIARLLTGLMHRR